MTAEAKKKGMMVPLKVEKDVCVELAKLGKDPDTGKKMKQYKIGTSCPIPAVSSVCLPQVHVSVRLCG
jgi:hypothetical protein